MLEHIARFTTQCGVVLYNDIFKLRLFTNSLTGPSFTWYVNLPTGSVQNWQDMERIFYNQFNQTEPNVTIADLTRLKQKLGKNVETYIAWFKNARNRCKSCLKMNMYI